MLKRWSVMMEKETVVDNVKEGLKSQTQPELVPAINHALLIKDFTQAIIDDREPYVNGMEGRRSIELIVAIYKSSKTNSIIDLPLRMP